MTRDEFYKAITSDMPFFPFGLMAIGVPFRSVWRFIDEERRAGLIETRSHLVPTITGTAPLHVSLPHEEPPDFGALCYAAEFRAKQDIGEETFCHATEKARKRYGGIYSGPVALANVQHHARLAAVYWLDLTPNERAAWVPEARLGDTWIDEHNVPDALVGGEICEVIGHSYSPEKCRRRAAAWKHLVVRWY